jgi:hypothetical protein
MYGNVASAQPSPDDPPVEVPSSTTTTSNPTTDASPTARDEAEIEYLMRTARNAARDGHCDSVVVIGKRLRTIAPAYYAATFATDAEVAACESDDGRKSPATAGLLSVAGTLAGITVGSILVGRSEVAGEHGDNRLGVLAGYSVAGAAFAFGPSLGRAYVGGTWNWWLRLRLIGVGAFILGAGLDFAGVTPRVVDAPPVGLTLGVLGGGVVYTIGMIGENVATPLTAVEHNERLTGRHDVALVPLHTRDGGGLALIGRF